MKEKDVAPLGDLRSGLCNSVVNPFIHHFFDHYAKTTHYKHVRMLKQGNGYLLTDNSLRIKFDDLYVGLQQTTKTMNKSDRIVQWVHTLESGEYKKGIGALHPTRNKYCCLGVCALIMGQKMIPGPVDDGNYKPIIEHLSLPPLKTDLTSPIINANDVLYKIDNDFKGLIVWIKSNIDTLWPNKKLSRHVKRKLGIIS